MKSNQQPSLFGDDETPKTEPKQVRTFVTVEEKTGYLIELITKCYPSRRSKVRREKIINKHLNYLATLHDELAKHMELGLSIGDWKEKYEEKRRQRRKPTIKERTSPCHVCSHPITHRHHVLAVAHYGENNSTLPLCANCHEQYHLFYAALVRDSKRAQGVLGVSLFSDHLDDYWTAWIIDLTLYNIIDDIEWGHIQLELDLNLLNKRWHWQEFSKRLRKSRSEHMIEFVEKRLRDFHDKHHK